MILNELFLRSKLSKSGLWTLKFTVSQELTDFLHAGTNSCKLKGLEVGVVKMGVASYMMGL